MNDRPGTSPLVEKLIDIAMTVLHHDGGNDEPPVIYERKVLSVKFTRAIREARLSEPALRRSIRRLLAMMASGRPADPRDGDKWDRAIRAAERVLHRECTG